MELTSRVLIDPTVALCREIQIHEDGPSICLRMETTQPIAVCPKCAKSSTRVHSRYRRRLADSIYCGAG